MCWLQKAKAAPISSAGWLKPLKEESGELQQQPLQQQATAVQPPPLQQQQQPEQGAIKLHHVICSSELLLKEVIGSGAEGKVGSACLGLLCIRSLYVLLLFIQLA